MASINTAAEARKNIGRIVYWDDVGSRYVMLRQGRVQNVEGKNIMIDGDWKWRPSLTNLRTTKGSHG